METFHSENYKNKIPINIYYDSEGLNPRADYDNFGKMVCFHREYELGDCHNFSTPEEFQEWLDEPERNGTICLPLYLYDHSGLTIATHPFSCPWDSGQVGWIYATPERMEKEGVDKKKALRILESEVKVYDAYLRGNVYGYVVEDPETGEEDSCWGYIETEYDVEKMYVYQEAVRIAEDILKSRKSMKRRESFCERQLSRRGFCHSRPKGSLHLGKWPLCKSLCKWGSE